MLPSLFYIGLIEVMNDRSWMYQYLPKGVRRMDYNSEVQGFINYIISNPRNINRDSIRCPYKRCKNKKFLDSDVVTMHLLQKEFIDQYLCWYAHGEPYVPYKIMVEIMVGSTFSASNVHGVV